MGVDQSLLERFEKAVEMPAYLSSRGFTASVSEPDRDHITMTAPNGTVLRLDRDSGGGWTYANARFPQDKGSLMSFLEKHERLDRRAGLELLIACADERRRDVPAAVAYRRQLQDKPADLRRAEVAYDDGWRRQRDADRMLERLGIAAASFDAWRFGAVRRTDHVTRLLDEPSPGALAHSRYRSSDRRLVLVERPIDAVAYEMRHGHQEACYIATGSALDGERKRQLAHLLAETRGLDVVLAYGRDRQGEALAAEIQLLAPMLRVERQGPAFGVRWADQLQLEARHARSLGRIADGPGIDRHLG